MSKKKKFLKVFLGIIAAIIIFFILVVVGTYSYFRFYLMSKLNTSGEVSSDDEAISITDIAKDFSDKQLIDNILHFDKQSATEMLVALVEIGAENAEQDQSNTEKKDEEKNPENDINKEVIAEGKNAYQRIMNEASKDEISEGMAIISKLDISKVNQLRKEGKNSEIKAYIKSVLTSGEISTALKLYNKYKHLL